MYSEKKRKRSELFATKIDTEQKESTNLRKKDKTPLSPKRPPPTEEEVEEFFAIIRRMKAAVMTLQKSGCGRGNHDSNSDQKLARPLEEDLLQAINVKAKIFGESQTEMKRGSGTRDNFNRVTDNNNRHQVTMMVEEDNAVLGSDGLRELDLNAVPTEAGI